VAGVQFDINSAGRIARATRAVEYGLPVPTKRVRRPSNPSVAGDLVLVRLLEDIPPATLVTAEGSTDSFYDDLRAAVGSNVGEADASALAAFLSQSELNTVGSGLAVLCYLEDTGDINKTTEGDSEFVRLSYGDVVTVYNAHPTGFNTINEGGFAGNEAGSLGAGFCDAITGQDGRLWLVNADRKLFVRAFSNVDDLVMRVLNLEAIVGVRLEYLKELLGIESWPDEP
jgi:hypothetical protein